MEDNRDLKKLRRRSHVALNLSVLLKRLKPRKLLINNDKLTSNKLMKKLSKEVGLMDPSH